MTTRSTRVLEETIVPFSESRKLEPPVHSNTLRNWAHHGLRNRQTGQRVYLEWAHYGNTPVTSREALARFQEKLNSEMP